MNNSFITMKYFFEKSRNEAYSDPERQHLCYELVYCKQGSGLFRINDVTVPFSEGMFAIFPHSFTVSESGCQTDCFYLGFEYNNFWGELSYGVFNDADRALLNIMQNMKTEMQAHTAFSDECLQAYLNILIYTLKISWKNTINATEPKVSSTLLSDIAEYFKQNYETHIDIVKYFENLGYSYHHLRHSFKEVYGISPNQYLMKTRINAAKKFLLTTDLGTDEIYKKCGFNSLTHFINNFKKYTGKNPIDFRKERG